MELPEIDTPLVVPALAPLTPPDWAAQNRMIRNSLLSQTDWTQVPDSPLNAETKSSYATYRQQLRDMTEFQNPVWPVPPGQEKPSA